MELYDKDGNRLYLYELYGYEIQTICASTSLLDHKLIEEIELSMQRNEEEYRETDHVENIIQELNLIHISIDGKILVPGW